MFPDFLQSEGKVLSTGVPAIDFEGMFGSMAGILNLWVGFTFFTLIEFVDLFYKLCEAIVKRTHGRAKGPRQTAVMPYNNQRY